MISAKFLGPQGGTLDGAIAAMYYLLDLKKRYNLNMVATSNSWCVPGAWGGGVNFCGVVVRVLYVGGGGANVI